MKTKRIIILWIVIYAVIIGGIAVVVLWQNRLNTGVPYKASYEMYFIPAGAETPMEEKVTLTLSEGRLHKDIFTGCITLFEGKAEMDRYCAKSDVSVPFSGKYKNYCQSGAVWIGDNKYAAPITLILRKEKGEIMLLIMGSEETDKQEGTYCYCTSAFSRSEIGSIFFESND